MSKESKDLKNAYTKAVEGIFDHFDEYTIEEKNQVKNSLAELQQLDALLSKYDKKTKKKTIWELIAECWNNAMGKK